MLLRTLQGDPNVPAGQLTLNVDLRKPVRLPDLEQQRSVEELSRLVLGAHQEAQRESQQGAAAEPSPTQEAAEGAAGGSSPGSRSGPGPEDGACSESSHSGSGAPPALEPQPFVLPLGVIARNEVYPRTCRMW